MSTVEVRAAGVGDAEVVHAVVRAAFAARPPLDPPAEALSETPAALAASLARHGGLLATHDGEPVGALVFDRDGPGLLVSRFGVVPGARGHGVAGRLVAAAEGCARDDGFEGVRVKARVELPESIRFWEHHGYVPTGRIGVTVRLVKVFARGRALATAEDTRAFGERLAGLLRPGDLVLLSGDLGAGKTTLTQGIGVGLGVRGGVTSPTFVIARVHPAQADGPDLVHVDAYRLGGIDELDDLDLDTALAEAVTVVEWGEDVAEGLADERLEVHLIRATGDQPILGDLEDSDPREVLLRPVGLRWLDAGLADLAGPHAG